jgi:uncharacterized cupredoxin-like copper-binding protein
MIRHSHWQRLVPAALILLLASAAHAAGEHAGGHGHGHGNGASIGKPGKAAEVSRTIEVIMTDNRFAPESISVAKGETVRFVVRNRGEAVHEFNIGTAAMHAGHQKEMAKMFEHGVLEVDKIHHDKMKMPGPAGMAHDDPNSVLLEPGDSGEIVWRFSNPVSLEFACNLPGHYETGMKGDFHFH